MKLLRSIAALLCLLQLAIVPAAQGAGASLPPPKPAAPGYINIDPSLTPKWLAALGRVYAKQGRAKFLALGDSTTAAAGAGSGSQGYIGAKQLSYPDFLGRLLAAKGVPISLDNAMGFANATNEPLYDVNVTYGSGWANSGVGTLGGSLTLNSTSTNALTFAPKGIIDTCLVTYLQVNSGAAFTIDVDGNVLATVNSAGSTATLTQTVNFARGTHAINIKRNGTGTNAYIARIDCYDSTTPAVSIYNGGTFGTTTTQQSAVNNSFDALNQVKALAPDLTIICLGINDANTSIPVATYIAQYQSIINAAKTSGDVIIVVPVPVDLANFPAIAQAARSLALTNNLPLIDLPYRFGSRASMIALGLSFDNFHPTAPGYFDVAKMVDGLLARL